MAAVNPIAGQWSVIVSSCAQTTTRTLVNLSASMSSYWELRRSGALINRGKVLNGKQASIAVQVGDQIQAWPVGGTGTCSMTI